MVQKYDGEFKESDLEKDLSYNLPLRKKMETREDYCTNLYRALCNNIWYKTGTNRTVEYSITWRGAGSVISNLLCRGDYIDWYCSGLEGTVTKEVADDLLAMGWKYR